MNKAKHIKRKTKRKLLRMALLKSIKLILDIIKTLIDILHGFRQ